MRNIFNSSFRVCHRSSCHSFWNTLFTILEKEQQQQQQKQKQTSPKTSTSKGFLLIPGSAQMVMQAKMQGQKTKMLSTKQKQKNGEQSVPKTMTGTSVTNSKTAVKNVSHDGYVLS
jgi:hypothetical protein